MKRKIITVLSACLLLFAYSIPALAAAPKTINKKDFVIKVGKKNIDLLKNGFPEIVSASGKQILEYNDSEEYASLYVAANEATFYGHADEDDAKKLYVDFVELTGKGATARGIKIGSTEAALFKAYRIKDLDWDDDDNKYYQVQATSSKGITSKDIKNLHKVRPVYYYSISFTVSKATNKVTGVIFGQTWGG